MPGINLISLESLICSQQGYCGSTHGPFVGIIFKSELTTPNILARVQPGLHQTKVLLSFLFEVEILLSDYIHK